MSDFLNIKSKTILVTGATGGIGRAICIMLSSYGAKLVLTGRNETELQETSAQCSGECKIIPADLSKEEDRTPLIKQIDKLDGMVYAAGILHPVPIHFIKEKDLDRVHNINFKAAALLSAHLVRQKKFNPFASLVYISSISAKFPYIGGSLYVSSKAALESFVRTLALEQSSKLRANLISPALVKTEMFERTLEEAGKEEMDKVISAYPLGIGEPDDVASTVAFLLSERSKWITGENIILDGGLSIGSKK